MALRTSRVNLTSSIVAKAGTASVTALAIVCPIAWLDYKLGYKRLERDRFMLLWIGIFFAGALVIFFAGSARYLLPIAVGIITVVTTIWSAGLSCSHDTLCVDAAVGSLTKESASKQFISRTRRAAFRYSACSLAPAS